MAMRAKHPHISTMKINGRDYVPLAMLEEARGEAAEWQAVAEEAVAALRRVQASFASLTERVKRAKASDHNTLDMFTTHDTENLV